MGIKICRSIMLLLLLNVVQCALANTTPPPTKHPVVHHSNTSHKAVVHHHTNHVKATHAVHHSTRTRHHSAGHHHALSATTNPDLSALPQVDDTEPTSNSSTNINVDSNQNFSVGHRVVTFVDNFISSLRYTRYKTGGNFFDSTRGIYEADCSHYVDRILQSVCPRAYWRLTASTGSQDPNSANYYNFFSRLSESINPDWNKIDNANQLQPGDVVVFRYKNSAGEMDGGHVMVVMGSPTQGNDGLLVRVSDSAFAGHSDDTRPAHDSGVGVGTILLKVDPTTGEPYAYAWDVDSPWKSNVNIAMARPTDFS